MCQFSNCEVGDSVSFTLSDKDNTACLVCGSPVTGEVSGTYMGHVDLGGYTADWISRATLPACPGCGDVKTYLYIWCDRGPFFQIEGAEITSTTTQTEQAARP